MRWWHSAFSSKSQSHDDSVIVGDEARFSLRSSLFPSRRERHQNRPRKVRQVSKNDVDVWRFKTSNSKPMVGSPQPLPLPELRVLLQHDPKFSPSSAIAVPLPSPHSVQNQRGVEETVNAEGTDGVNAIISKWAGAGLDTQANSEDSEIWSCGKSMQKPKARSSESFNLSVPNSAPSSPFESPSPSPSPSPPRVDFWPTQYMTPPATFQARSSPDTPHLDGKSNFDNSPVQSSGANCHLYPSPPRTASPLTTKMSCDSPFSRRESNIHGNVHPLPRPPGAAMSSQTTPASPVGSKFEFLGAPVASQSAPVSLLKPKLEHPSTGNNSQSSPISPCTSKPEVMPIKSQWQKGKLIGRGTFGSVYVASNRETGALCAMKEVEILPDDSKSAERVSQLQQEIKVLSQLKHQNIVQYYGSEIVGDKFCIYLEYVHPGSVNKFISDHCEAITESVVRNFTRHILCGLAYLHSTKTIHRDIKGANLLVDVNGVVKLADFGMAKHLKGQSEILSLKGSPYWMAPELLQSSMQTDGNSDTAFAVDIWSLGCTIIEMMSGKPPWSEYEGPAALFKVLKETPPIPETLSDDGKDFLQCCFRRNPTERPSASKLLDHPFVSQSYQPADSCSSRPHKEKRFMDNMQLRRDLPRHKSDQLSVASDPHIKKGKLGYNFARNCFPPVRLMSREGSL